MPLDLTWDGFWPATSCSRVADAVFAFLDFAGRNCKLAGVGVRSQLRKNCSYSYRRDLGHTARGARFAATVAPTLCAHIRSPKTIGGMRSLSAVDARVARSHGAHHLHSL